MKKLTVISIFFMLQATHISDFKIGYCCYRSSYTVKHTEIVELDPTSWYRGYTCGATDCTPPWMTQKNPFYTKILSKTVYRCPSLFGDSNKVYCCYNTDGDVECCDFQEYFIFKLICLIPIILIVLIILSFVSCLCCFLCPFCMIYKRRQMRSCSAPPPYHQTTTRFPQRPATVIYTR